MMKNKSKKIIQAAVAITVVLAFVMPGSAVIAYNDDLELPPIARDEVATAKLVCQIEGEKVIKELPVDTIQEIIELGKSCEQDFYTIYNKWETDHEVDIAFNNIEPFFRALVDSGLTEKSVEDLNELFRDIRNKIGKPRRDPSYLYLSKEGAQPSLYIWNGIPLPIAANVMCGLYTVGTGVVGYSLGTHTILPGPGLDVWNTWFMTGGNGGSIGFLGATLVAISEFAMTVGFIGILLGVWPSGIIAPFIFQVGLAMLYIGVSVL